VLLFIVVFITWIEMDFCKQTKQEYYATLLSQPLLQHSKKHLQLFTDVSPKTPYNFNASIT